MERTLINFLNGKIHQLNSINPKIILFNNGDVIQEADVLDFWGYVEQHKNGKLALSINDAINNNLTTYLAKRPCRKGHIAIRNLKDKCDQCATHTPPPLDGRASPMSIMMRNAPDMVISKDDALRVGFTVYRTGAPCRHGHSDYRYVNNKTCVACSRLY